MIEKILQFLNNNFIASKLKQISPLPNDKTLHYLYGTLIYLLIAIYNPIIAIISILLIAVGKEVYDYFMKDKHTPDIWDIVYTVIVPVVLTVIYIIFK